MATKLGRKEAPSGVDPATLTYQGRPATEQNDFGPDVGIADMVCVSQFGDSNNNKYYHAGVVKSGTGAWFVYLEWGRVTGGKSWNPSFRGQDYQFVQCSNEADARAFFAKQCADKNTKRIEQKTIGSSTIWVGKDGKDGYVVQRLATRSRGLPDAYLIKDDAGLQKKAAVAALPKAPKAKLTSTAHPQVISLARALVGGTADYSRAAQQSTGIVPTLGAIQEVRNSLIPDALVLLAKIGSDEKKQLANKELQKISTYVASIVPRPIPRSGDASAVILSQGNIGLVQMDLDAFEAALNNEDFAVETQKDNELDPNVVLGRELSWIDPTSEQGRWVSDAYVKMTNNRHGGIGTVRVLNMFEVNKPALRKPYLERAAAIAKLRKGQVHERAGLQPAKRPDLGELSDIYGDANICLGIHGTRAVNVQPIMASNLRLPKSLKGVQITGAAFGHGVYFATDWKKSHGYVGDGDSRWVQGGTIKSRGFFMFLCDLTLGLPYMAKTTMWDQTDCPKNHDSIFAKQGRTSVQNDEHVIFDPNQQYIRYLIEGTVR